MATEEQKAKERDQKLTDQEQRLEQMMKMIESIKLEQKMKSDKPFSSYIEL
ncbi:MAG: hypothetical protein PHU51_04205 [Candidatus Nanoarchaeia archaeon]|nr:hypothetical protein [Candidatus Nanoarchaeia archaeon]